MTLGERIRRLRKIAHLRQDELAEMAGLSPATISMWENDQTEPKYFGVIRIVTELGAPLTVLTDPEPDWRAVERALLEHRLAALSARIVPEGSHSQVYTEHLRTIADRSMLIPA